jgi:hypothetical protein
MAMLSVSTKNIYIPTTYNALLPTKPETANCILGFLNLYENRWLKKVSEFEGTLFPGLEIKAFDRDQKVEAEAWLSS